MASSAACDEVSRWTSQKISENFFTLAGSQPYHRGDSANDHPLAILSALSNFDKHRSIPIVALVPNNSQATVTSTSGVAKWGSVTCHGGRAYEKGAVIAECKMVPDDSGLDPHVYMHLKTEFDIGFGAIKTTPSLRNKPAILFIKDVLGVFIIDEVFNRVTEIWNAAVQANQNGDPEPLKQLSLD